MTILVYQNESPRNSKVHCLFEAHLYRHLSAVATMIMADNPYIHPLPPDLQLPYEADPPEGTSPVKVKVLSDAALHAWRDGSLTGSIITIGTDSKGALKFLGDPNVAYLGKLASLATVRSLVPTRLAKSDRWTALLKELASLNGRFTSYVETVATVAMSDSDVGAFLDPLSCLEPTEEQLAGCGITRQAWDDVVRVEDIIGSFLFAVSLKKILRSEYVSRLPASLSKNEDITKDRDLRSFMRGFLINVAAIRLCADLRYSVLKTLYKTIALDESKARLARTPQALTVHAAEAILKVPTSPWINSGPAMFVADTGSQPFHNQYSRGSIDSGILSALSKASGQALLDGVHVTPLLARLADNLAVTIRTREKLAAAEDINLNDLESVVGASGDSVLAGVPWGRFNYQYGASHKLIITDGYRTNVPGAITFADMHSASWLPAALRASGDDVRSRLVGPLAVFSKVFSGSNGQSLAWRDLPVAPFESKDAGAPYRNQGVLLMFNPTDPGVIDDPYDYALSPSALRSWSEFQGGENFKVSIQAEDVDGLRAKLKMMLAGQIDVAETPGFKTRLDAFIARAMTVSSIDKGKADDGSVVYSLNAYWSAETRRLALRPLVLEDTATTTARLRGLVLSDATAGLRLLAGNRVLSQRLDVIKSEGELIESTFTRDLSPVRTAYDVTGDLTSMVRSLSQNIEGHVELPSARVIDKAQ